MRILLQMLQYRLMTKLDSHGLRVLFEWYDSWTKLFDGVKDDMVMMETKCIAGVMVHIGEIPDQLCSYHILKKIFHYRV